MASSGKKPSLRTARVVPESKTRPRPGSPLASSFPPDRSRPSRLCGALFVVLDTQATLFEIAPGVSLWYPSAGLNLALVLIFGVQYTPAIFVALVGSGLLISDPIPIRHLLLPNLAIAIGNGGVAWILRRALRGRALATPGSMVRLIGAMAALATWNSVLAPTSYLLTGLEGYALGTLPTTAFKWGVGDWAGMLTLTPLLLVAALAAGVRTVPESRPPSRRSLRKGPGRPEQNPPPRSPLILDRTGPARTVRTGRNGRTPAGGPPGPAGCAL